MKKRRREQVTIEKLFISWLLDNMRSDCRGTGGTLDEKKGEEKEEEVVAARRGNGRRVGPNAQKGSSGPRRTCPAWACFRKG